MAYDAGLVERLRDVIARAGERSARDRGIFGGRGFLLGKSAFVIAWGDGVIVKCAPDEYQAALTLPGTTPFAPDGERPMGTWVVVSADAIADDPELLEWVERGLRGVRAVPSPRAGKGKGGTTVAKRSSAKRPAAKDGARPRRAPNTESRRGR